MVTSATKSGATTNVMISLNITTPPFGAVALIIVLHFPHLHHKKQKFSTNTNILKDYYSSCEQVKEIYKITI